MCAFGIIRAVSVQDFIYNDLGGNIDLKRSVENLQALCEAWSRNPHQNFLIDLRDADVQLSPEEVRQLCEAVLDSGIGQGRRAAIIYNAPKRFDPVRFFGFLILKDGRIQLKICEDFEEAMQWLSLQSPAELFAEKVRQNE